MTVILFLAVLFVLILVHEWGHYIVAKKTDMQVDEFAIGFPPRLFSRKYGETEYSLNALPIGGYVKIVGENAEDIAEGQTESTNDRSFVAKSKTAQALVLVAGVVMNVIFAWFLFIVVFSLGVPNIVDEAEATDAAELVVTSVLPDSPAAAADIPIGAKITSLSQGDAVVEALTPSAFTDFTSTYGTEPMTLTYQKGDIDFIVSVTPEAGLVSDDPERLAVGLALGLAETVRQPIHLAVWEATKTTVSALGAITVGLGALFGNLVVGEADLSQVAGPVGIAGMVGDAADFGLTSLLMFTAIISLNLAVINLLPFPALDGGRLVMVGIEAATRRPINPVWVGRLNVIGFVLLLGLMVAVTYADILRLL